MQFFFPDVPAIPLPPGHRFPSGKYDALRALIDRDRVLGRAALLPAMPVDRATLLRAHSAAYVDAMLSGTVAPDAMRRIGLPWSETLVARSRATVAGQGTVALEWDAQTDAGLDTVLVAVGGGGLIAGIAAWWRGSVRVIGVEPQGSRALHAALAAGAPVDVEVNSIAADSLGAKRAGALPFAIAQQWVEAVTLVPDAAIAAAQLKLWTDLRIAAEPGGATAFAALLSGAYRPASGERVGVLVCGANVDLAGLASTVAGVTA